MGDQRVSESYKQLSKGTGFVSEDDLPSSSKEAEEVVMSDLCATTAELSLWEPQTSPLLSESKSEGEFCQSKAAWITR